jgi:soluble lytic murein transglycosylase-like protein
VVAGGGGRFSIAPNPNADATAPLHEWAWISQVDGYDAEITQVAAELGIDPDLIRAIMYVETTHGWYGVPADFLAISDSILPMNVSLDFWGDVFGPRSNLDVPLNNIRAGATILSGIIANLPATASVAEIATLYNSLSATRVSDYGARVEAVFKSRLWDR